MRFPPRRECSTQEQRDPQRLFSRSDPDATSPRAAGGIPQTKAKASGGATRAFRVPRGVAMRRESAATAAAAASTAKLAASNCFARYSTTTTTTTVRHRENGYSERHPPAGC